MLLYKELMKGRKSDNEVIKQLLSSLDSNITGWLIIRAKKFLAARSEKYNADMNL